MNFDEIPFELKEHIFSFVSPDEWINTAKCSSEWMDLTLGSIKRIESCHALILDHLAEFINQQRNTNYTWVSLQANMPKLVHLECFENTDVFLTEISPVCHQLKVLNCNPTVDESLDWNLRDISFKNLLEIRWDGNYEEPAFLLRIFELAPKLEKITLKRFKINAEWKNKIPKSVKHILLDDVLFVDEHQCSMNNTCEDSSTLETFSAFCKYSNAVSHIFGAPRLKKLVLSHPNASDILEDAFTKCPYLESVCIYGGSTVHISDRWRKCIPASVNAFKTSAMKVENNVRPDFSFDWLFQNYGALQSLEVKFVDMIEVDSHKFHYPKNQKKLYLNKYMPHWDDNDPFSDICYHMIGGSHLIDVVLHGPEIDESWEHIFPPTVKRLKMRNFWLLRGAKQFFSPQFLCENPSNIEFLSLNHSDGELPAMNLNPFYEMNRLHE